METVPLTLAGVASRGVRTDGDDSLPPFLFLHGFSDSADGWRRVQRRLEAHGCRSLAIDQPSHGHADPLTDDRPAIDQFVEFAAAAADELGHGSPVIVVGNSLGGAHSLLLAQRHPDLVRGVVAISPAGFDHPRYFRVLDDDNRAGQRLRRMRERAEANGSTTTAPTPLQRTVGRAVASNGIRLAAFGRPWRAPRGFVDEWRKQWRDPARRSALRELVPRIRKEYLDESPFDLASIETPVLALWGTEDRLVLVSSRKSLERGLPDVEFVELPSIGHMPQLESPGRTTKHLLRFARRLG